jgi:hypothetical protein
MLRQPLSRGHHRGELKEGGHHLTRKRDIAEKDTSQSLDPSSLNPKLRIKDLPWFLGFSSRYPGLPALQGTHWVHTVPSEGFF